jgi:methylase of polypeptide subunit release factors
MAEDAYAVSGEFIDVLSQDAWRALRGPISRALRAAVPSQGPIVDVGAGTGLGALVAADTVPDTEIIAVEPCPSCGRCCCPGWSLPTGCVSG